jgi:RHS repeat-associated protein
VLIAFPEAAKKEIPLFGPPCADPDPAWETSHVVGNSRQGFRLLDSTLRLASSEVKSRTALGIAGVLYDGGIRSRCTGKERDSESNLDYFGARYDSSAMGRFMTPDYTDDDEGPVSVPFYNPLNPQSLNLYSYAHNNPVTDSDPDGHDCVVQTRTSDKSESVSVSSGTCDGVKTGDGQSATYVPGTVAGVQAGQDGKSIDIGYTPYQGGGYGDQNANAAPYPDRPGLAYGFNEAGYRTLGTAGATMNDPRTYALWAGASAVAGAALVGTGVIGGGGLTTLGESGLLANDLTDHAVGRLAAHGISPAEARAAIEAAKQAGTFVQTMGRYGPQIRYVANGIKVVVATTGANAGKIITAFHK